MGSIRRAVVKCQSMPVAAPEMVVAESLAAAPHSEESESVAEQFKRKVLERYSSVQEAWKAFNDLSDIDGISRKDFKSVLSSLLGMKITSAEKGKLRRQIDQTNTKVIREEDFSAFFGRVPNTSAASSAQTQQAVLPMDCPKLPDAYRSRPKTEKSIVDLLVGKSKTKSSYVVAVGMGGVG